MIESYPCYDETGAGRIEYNSRAHARAFAIDIAARLHAARPQPTTAADLIRTAETVRLYVLDGPAAFYDARLDQIR